MINVSADVDYAIFRSMGKVYFRTDLNVKVKALKSLKCFKGRDALSRYLVVNVNSVDRLKQNKRDQVIIRFEKLLSHMTKVNPAAYSALKKRSTAYCGKKISEMDENERSVLSADLYLKSLPTKISFKSLSSELENLYPHFMLNQEKTKELWNSEKK